MDMFDLAAHRARVNPEQLALEDLADGTRYTYDQLNAQASRYAAAARTSWGLRPGDRLAWLGHSRAEFFIMLFGCAKAGLILVPLNWRLAVPELAALLDDSRPTALIYGAEFAATAASLKSTHPDMLCVGLDPAGINHGDRGYTDDLARASFDPAPHPPRSPDTPWYLLYTSGTTGRPKGVIQTFRMMLANYLNIGIPAGLNGEDVFLNVLPLFHTGGINLYSSCILLVGGTVLVQRGFEAAQALRVLEQRATVFFGVPTIYHNLLEHKNFAPERLRHIRSWACGGAALPAAISQRYLDHGIRVRTGMGMTETGPTVFLLDEARVADKPGAVGRPQLVAEVRIADARGVDVAPGAAGELLIRGPGITPGYWERPDATREAFTADGWFRSGDVARRDTDGDYYIVDRWKDMYISGGENVYPAEVEAVLLQHPAIAEAAVIGVADPRWGERGHASLVLRPGMPPPAADELRAFCRARLAGYKTPAGFHYLPALPRNVLGKVIKQELRDALQP